MCHKKSSIVSPRERSARLSCRLKPASAKYIPSARRPAVRLFSAGGLCADRRSPQLKPDAAPVALPAFLLTVSCDTAVKKNAPRQMVFRQ
jgi:hypothetical protein